jgi:hypothetical protein
MTPTRPFSTPTLGWLSAPPTYPSRRKVLQERHHEHIGGPFSLPIPLDPQLTSALPPGADKPPLSAAAAPMSVSAAGCLKAELGDPDHPTGPPVGQSIQQDRGDGVQATSKASGGLPPTPGGRGGSRWARRPAR